MADNIDNQYNWLLSKLNDAQFTILSHKYNFLYELIANQHILTWCADFVAMGNMV
jgi:hypothetical protein